MARHAGNRVECQPADSACIERDYIGYVPVRVNGIKADDFTREVETQHLFLPFVINNITLEATGAYRCDGAKLVPGAEQVLSRLDWTGTMDYLLKAFGLIGGQSAREAKLTESATAAGNLRAGGLTTVISNISYS
jgi:hypothetical protein